MKITEILVNHLKEPLGFDLSYLRIFCCKVKLERNQYGKRIS